MFSKVALFAQAVSTVNGVRTVTYKPGATPAGQWSLTPKPLQRIASDNGVEIVSVNGVARQSDGTLVILSRESSDLRFFDANGKHLRNVGRKGQGPGEFEAKYGLTLFRLRDSIVVSDGNGIAQVFAPDGKYVRTESRPAGGPQGQQISRGGFFADGRAVLQMYPTRRDTTAPARKMMFYTMFAQAGATRTELARFPAYERLNVEGGSAVRTVFGAMGDFAVLPNGFCVGFSNVMALSCFAPDGKQVSRVERQGVLGAVVTAADKEAHLAEIARLNPDHNGAAFVARMRETSTYAKRMPAFGQLVASQTNEVWIGPALPPVAEAIVSQVSDHATVWSVFSFNGDWLSDITLPKRFRLMEVGANYVAGILRDEDDVEDVVVYSIVKR